MKRLVLTTLLWATAVLAQAPSDSLQTKRAAELRSAPGDSATTVAQLPAQTPLTRLTARQGPWIQVRTTQGGIGWVHMFDVTANNNSSSSSSNNTGGISSALRGLGSWLNKGGSGSNSNAGTSTVGIRGLGAEDIANAQPNLAALQQAETLRIDAARARQFAANAPLRARQAPDLPTPPAPSTRQEN